MIHRTTRGNRFEPDIRIRAVEPADIPVIVALTNTASAEPWPPDGVAQVMALPGCWALVAAIGNDRAGGFVLGRTAADESEILNLIVDPAARRQGLGRALVVAAMRRAALDGATAILLEVAADNVAALALYESKGFEIVGRRPDYYTKTDDDPTDALIMRAHTRILDEE